MNVQRKVSMSPLPLLKRKKTNTKKDNSNNKKQQPKP